MLHVFTMEYRNHTSLVVSREQGLGVEIHGLARLEIAVAVLNNYPMKLHVHKEYGPIVLIEAGSDEARLYEALEALQALRSPVRKDEDFRDFLKNPTLELLEAFVAVKKLVEEGQRGTKPVKILLVPWVKSYDIIALRIHQDNNGKIWLNSYAAEIPTLRGQKIAFALIQRHAESIRLTVPSFLKNPRMAAEVIVPDTIAERLLFALKHLGDIVSSRKIPESLVENPTLEGLESFLFMRKLLE